MEYEKWNYGLFDISSGDNSSSRGLILIFVTLK